MNVVFQGTARIGDLDDYTLDPLPQGTGGQWYTILAGQDYLEIALDAKADHLVEGDEDVILQLLSGSGYTLGGSTQAGVTIAERSLDLVAHRTGLNFGQAILEADEDDPANYLILTNNDAEESDDGERDYDDATALIPTGEADPVDDDLARLTLKQIVPDAAGGTIELVASDPGAVRFFDADGNMLSGLGETVGGDGYLAGLTSGDVDVWVEGLHKNPDLGISLVYRDGQGNELARDTVRMMIAEWTFVHSDGSEADDISPVPAGQLLSALAGVPDQPGLSDINLFRPVIGGLSSDEILSLTMPSDVGDSVSLPWQISTSQVAPANFGLVYCAGGFGAAPDGQRLAVRATENGPGSARS